MPYYTFHPRGIDADVEVVIHARDETTARRLCMEHVYGPAKLPEFPNNGTGLDLVLVTPDV